MPIAPLLALAVLATLITLRTFRVVNEYERGVKFTFGKFESVMAPGIRTVIPIMQTWERVDMRVKAVDVPQQESITRDNVTVSINAVIYYKVRDARKAIIEVERYTYAVPSPFRPRGRWRPPPTGPTPPGSSARRTAPCTCARCRHSIV